MIENLDPLARLLLEAMLNTLWQGTIIAALVWLSLRLAKRASATTRHAVWLVTLLTIGALPFAAIVAKRDIPPTGSTVQPARRETAAPAIQSASPTVTPEARQNADPFLIDSEIARLNSPVRQFQPRIKEDFIPSPQPAAVTGIATLDESSKAVPAAAIASSKVEKMSLWRRARNWVANVFSGIAPLALTGLWLAVCALMMWRIALSYKAVFRMRSQLGFVPSHQRERVRRLAGMFGIGRPVHVFTSGQVSAPMTIGSFKPLIILPSDLAASLSPPDFESVVAHELAHIKRWDYLTNLLQRLAQSFLFFHPAVWFINKQLMIERELACDDWVVKTCEPRRYASCLTKLVESLNESKPKAVVKLAAAGIIFGKHVISRRVEMILNRDRNATTAVSKPALLYSIGLVAFFIAMCSLISPVIAVPLGQKPARQEKKESKAVTPATTKSQEWPPLPPLPPLPLDESVEPPDFPDLQELHDPPIPPIPALPSITVIAAPEAELVTLPREAINNGVWDVITGVVTPAAPLPPVSALAQQVTTPHPAPAPSSGVPHFEQDSRNRTPAIPETELLTVLTDIVKRDTDPNVRNEALQGIYRLRSDAAINALIQLYDGVSDVKVKSEIIGYLLRREGDNSKAIAKLTTIAKSEQNEELRNRAIRYLGNVKGDDGANTLIQIYDGLQDPKMKQYVIRSLAANRSRKAIDKLIQIAKNDSDPAVRQYAVRSLYGIDSGLYLELLEKERRAQPRIGMLDGREFFVTPRAFDFNGNVFQFDTKKWEDWQRDWQRKWEEQNERMREMIDKLRIEGLEKLKIEDLQNRLRIEMPKIELQLKELEDKVRLGYQFERIGAVESQLRSQLSAVEAQLATMRNQLTDTHPKTAEMRNLRNALERQLNSVRTMRTTTPRPATNRGRTNVSGVRAATPVAPSSF
jgi:beta-lactamase regulating signal transducer with metallopeptidase domain/HEAT repeat protein